jgi:hypothetical protein
MAGGYQQESDGCCDPGPTEGVSQFVRVHGHVNRNVRFPQAWRPDLFLVRQNGS